MLVLYELKELDRYTLECIVQLSDDYIVYVVSEELYEYFRYVLRINVDMAYLKDNHIYLPTGEINDKMDVYSLDLERHLKVYGVNCNMKFQSIHDVYNNFAEAFE